MVCSCVCSCVFLRVPACSCVFLRVPVCSCVFLCVPVCSCVHGERKDAVGCSFFSGSAIEHRSLPLVLVCVRVVVVRLSRGRVRFLEPTSWQLVHWRRGRSARLRGTQNRLGSGCCPRLRRHSRLHWDDWLGGNSGRGFRGESRGRFGGRGWGFGRCAGGLGRLLRDRRRWEGGGRNRGQGSSRNSRQGGLWKSGQGSCGWDRWKNRSGRNGGSTQSGSSAAGDRRGGFRDEWLWHGGRSGRRLIGGLGLVGWLGLVGGRGFQLVEGRGLGKVSSGVAQAQASGRAEEVGLRGSRVIQRTAPFLLPPDEEGDSR